MVNFWVAMAFSIPISIIDIKTLKIPNMLLFGYLLTLFTIDIYHHSYCTLVVSLISSMAIFLLFYAIYFFIGGIGFGDVKYISIIGYALGFQKGIYACLIASLIGIVFFASLYLISLKRQKNSTISRGKIPFGPFLSFGLVFICVM